MKACFVAGTPIRTPEGSKAIELFRTGDLVLSRDEHDANGALAFNRVVQTFVRISPILNLHVCGRIIGTTAEHPFFVRGKGWVDAHQLSIGDELQTSDGRWLACAGVAYSGRVETVYNMEVEDYHTYFVGDAAWGWDVWAHNASSFYNPAFRSSSPEAVAAARKAFKNTEKTKFVKEWASSAQAKRMLTADELKLASRKGVLPSHLVVHHKTPLYRGGTNEYNNLRVMRQDFHLKFREPLHNYQPGMNTYGP